jgi:hypothetical protein
VLRASSHLDTTRQSERLSIACENFGASRIAVANSQWPLSQRNSTRKGILTARAVRGRPKWFTTFSRRLLLSRARLRMPPESPPLSAGLPTASAGLLRSFKSPFALSFTEEPCEPSASVQRVPIGLERARRVRQAPTSPAGQVIRRTSSADKAASKAVGILGQRKKGRPNRQTAFDRTSKSAVNVSSSTW